jgi:hypothetical protein
MSGRRGPPLIHPDSKVDENRVREERLQTSIMAKGVRNVTQFTLNTEPHGFDSYQEQITGSRLAASTWVRMPGSALDPWSLAPSPRESRLVPIHLPVVLAHASLRSRKAHFSQVMSVTAS